MCRMGLERIWRGLIVRAVGILSFDTRQSFKAMNLRYWNWVCCVFDLLCYIGLNLWFMQFDYLKSLEIEEKINKIRWCQMANGTLFLLSTNDKTIKSWKVYVVSSCIYFILANVVRVNVIFLVNAPLMFKVACQWMVLLKYLNVYHRMT